MSSRISVRRSTVALWLVFFVNGAVLASWAPRIPEVKSGLSLSDGQVGWTLLGVAAGSIPALIGTARVLSWVSVRQVCAITAFTFPLALPLIALAPNGWALAAALTVLGFASGSLDVAMNSAAIEWQNRTDTTILSRLHGGYSLGVLVGAVFGAVATVFDVSVVAHFCVVSACLMALAVGASTFLPPTDGPKSAFYERNSLPRGSRVRCSRRLSIPVSVAVMAIAALLVEGMVTDWSALLLSRDYAAGDSIGAAAVVVFSCSMFLSRSCGDFVVDRLGARTTVSVAAAVIATATFLGLVVQEQFWGAVVALGFIGAALGPVFPILITAAGRRGRDGLAVATAQVSVVGYGAFLGGPPLVGLLAEKVGLSGAFVLIVFVCCLVLAGLSTLTDQSLAHAADRDDAHRETR